MISAGFPGTPDSAILFNAIKVQRTNRIVSGKI
jgi:hypothetical protein